MSFNYLPLYKHQEAGMQHVIANNGKGALFHEVGCGKTRTAIEIYKHYKGLDNSLKMLVICPVGLIDWAWGVEGIPKWSDFSWCNLRGKYKDADIYLINFEGISVSKKKRLEIEQLLSKHQNWMCVIDESSKMKNFKSLITQTLLSMREKFKIRVIMSGTPAPNLEDEYWGQMQFLGNVFSSDCRKGSYHKFKNCYFHLEQRGKVFNQGQIISRIQMQEMFKRGVKYAIDDKSREMLIKRMQPWAHWAYKKDCLDLPDQVDEIRVVYLSPEQRKLYKTMERDCFLELQKSEVVATTALTKVMKLRQITSGFSRDTENRDVLLPSNAKLKELMQVLDELGRKQAIIWFCFNADMDMLKAKLNPEQYSQLDGRVNVTDRPEEIRKFVEGETQYLLAKPASAGHGLTLVNCDTEIFYSLDYSFENYKQAKGRTHRPGQNNTCVYIHLLAQDTIDETVYKVLGGKGKKEDFVIDFLQKARGRI